VAQVFQHKCNNLLQIVHFYQKNATLGLTLV